MNVKFVSFYVLICRIKIIKSSVMFCFVPALILRKTWPAKCDIICVHTYKHKLFLTCIAATQSNRLSALTGNVRARSCLSHSETCDHVTLDSWFEEFFSEFITPKSERSSDEMKLMAREEGTVNTRLLS